MTAHRLSVNGLVHGTGFPTESLEAGLDRDPAFVGVDADVPLLVGSATTAGAAVHVEWTVDLVEELARKEGLEFELGVVYSEQSPPDP